MMLPTPLVLALALATAGDDPIPPVVHSVSDISQTFTFYMDGRFHRQYLDGVGRDARNWGSLEHLDLENVNLLILTAGDAHIPYTEAALDHVEDYVRDGGTALIMADGQDPMPPGAALTAHFGATLTTSSVTPPLETTPAARRLIDRDHEWVFRRGTVLELSRKWTVHLRDEGDRPVFAARDLGKGHVLLGSRGLFGSRPDASDPINAEAWTPLLVHYATSKRIDPDLPHNSTWAEHERELGGLILEFHDGTERYADAVAAEYKTVHPHLVAITGVEPSEGMIKRLLILPTGGGGFSSGQRIAIGAWWGNYPERRYPMVELIGHEAGHSWVLPHAEPLWNEPIATYLGIQVGLRLDMDEAQQTLDKQIARGRALDPDFTTIDPLSPDAPRDLIWGKSYFVFEELERLHGPGALAKYFRTKRELLPKGGRNNYTMDDCVAVWSTAVGEDLFPWFASLAFDVDESRTSLWPR